MSLGQIVLRCGQARLWLQAGLRGLSAFDCLPRSILKTPLDVWDGLGPHAQNLNWSCEGYGSRKPVPQNFPSPTWMTESWATLPAEPVASPRTHAGPGLLALRRTLRPGYRAVQMP